MQNPAESNRDTRSETTPENDSPTGPDSDERVCVECGQPIDPGDIICPHCGTALVGG